MYSAKFYCEITLTHNVEIQRIFLIYIRDQVYIYIRPGPNPDDIKTAVFLSKRKSTNRPKIIWFFFRKFLAASEDLKL